MRESGAAWLEVETNARPGSDRDRVCVSTTIAFAALVEELETVTAQRDIHLDTASPLGIRVRRADRDKENT